MNLVNLLEYIKMKEECSIGSCEREIKGIAYNSKNVRPGFCFVAIRGRDFDGHDFVGDAVSAGATVIVSERPVDLPEGVENIVVDNSRDALARLSAKYFDDPSKKMRLIGITGTNGKTTITYLIESVLKACGAKVGVVGTVNYRYGNVCKVPLHTTPESYELQGLLKSMLDSGVSDVILEVSSHALDQERVVECHFDGAIFTNLTQDHLDYHGNMESYGEAKQRLFTERLPVSGKRRVWAAVNWDDPFGREMVKKLQYPVYRFSIRESVEVYALEEVCDLDGIRMRVVTPEGAFDISSKLKGRFNASNILAAVTACVALRIPIEKIRKGIEAVHVIPGRLEAVETGRGISVFVDYAHTPDALENVLMALRPLTSGRLITVFGCGGNRDHGKRPLMGETAAKLSDAIVVTTDNPRDEQPALIISQILPGVLNAGMKPYNDKRGYFVIEDRREAIEKALSVALEGDVVLIAGKGHENYQIVGGERRHFDDREVVSNFLGLRGS